MPDIDTAAIEGVRVVRLSARGDERGRFMETYRDEWFPDAPPMVQGSRSDSKAGVVRALHYHLHQADYWYCPFGRLFVGMYDLRRSSPTRGTPLTVEIGEGAELGIYIPPGVAHGFQALVHSTLTYMVDRYYDPNDENGVTYNDPALGINWPMDDAILSDRDKQNPMLADIPEDRLPA